MSKVQTPLVTVDCVVVYNRSILLIQRKYTPFKNYFALPGGFVDIGETVEEACIRELYEETNVKIKKKDLKLIGVYSNPKRDPQRNTISVAFLTKLKKRIMIQASDDALTAQFIKITNKIKLAFDHSAIIKDALTKLNI